MTDDDFDEEVEEENLEQEMEEFDEEEEKKAKAKAKPKKKAKAAEEEVPAEVFEAFHLPERMGIVNNITQEIIEGFSDIGSAQALAKILNMQDKIEASIR